MGVITPLQRPSLPEDASGNAVETVHIDKWLPQRVDVLEGSWVALPATPMDGRTAILVQALVTNTHDIILAPSDTGFSNSKTNAACGIILPPGASIEPNFTDLLLVYARVEAGGTAGAVIVSEAK